MMPCERKSVESITAVTAPARVGAQHQSAIPLAVSPAAASYRERFSPLTPDADILRTVIRSPRAAAAAEVCTS